MPTTARQEYYLELLENVWLDEGPQPWYHRQVKRWLQRKWPLLYAALQGLVESKAHVALQAEKED